MSDSHDANLSLKKRARRRLMGAVAFAGLAAVVLPMVMDDEPKQQIQDVQIRIPGQDQVPAMPQKVTKPPTTPVPGVKAATPEKPEPVAAAAVATRPAETPVDKPAEKKTEKPVEKVAGKTTEKPAKSTAGEPQRAAAILEGKSAAAASSGSANGQFVILIGAFSNPANVKQLETKIGELGVKVFTEPLDSPGGKKTRVRAGPFPNREAAEKALDRMKRIGVNGIVAAK